MTPTKTTMDWLRYRTQAEVPSGLNAMRPMFGPLGHMLNLEHLPRGKDGFKQGAAVRIADQVVGRVDFGGESQRGWVRWNLTGQGCEHVTDWDAIAEVEALPSAELRRADIALTTWRGEVTHGRVAEAHKTGGFNCGGRPPNMLELINSDPDKGSTINIGNRKADKFLRCYEKGLQMCDKYGIAVEGASFDGHPVRGIYRCEVELKADEHVLPWELVERRDQYFSGCYPFLAELLPDLESDILMRRPERLPRLELAATLSNIKTMWGTSLYTCLWALDGDIGRLMQAIVGTEHNKALLAAGVLLVEHE